MKPFTRWCRPQNSEPHATPRLPSPAGAREARTGPAVLAGAMLVLAAASTALPASAAVDDCIKAHRGHVAGHHSAVQVETACLQSAAKGVKISQVLLARTYYTERQYRKALPWLQRAAYGGDHVASFLLAGTYHHLDQHDRAVIWASRAAHNLEQARHRATGPMRAYLDRTMGEVRRLVGPEIDSWIHEGQARIPAAREVSTAGLFGKWRIGPNSNCDTAYTWIGADGAASYLAGRELAYQRVIHDETAGRVILKSGQGSLTLVKIDANTLKVIGATESGSRQARGGTVLATRCL